jgi:DNA-binding protein Fis
VVSDGKVIEPDNLSLSYYRNMENPGIHEISGDISLRELEKKTIVNALVKTKGNQTRAARSLGISRKMIMTKIEKYKISNIVPVRTRKLKKT